MGVEEELLLVDALTHEPVAAGRAIVGRAGHEGVKVELLGHFVETATRVCATPREAFEELVALRATVAAAARDEGFEILAAGSHPFAVPEEQPVVDEPHYLEFAALAGPVARRQGVCGLHVHVGMPDPETCVRAHERALPWLPVVLALGANSPWFRGEKTGLLSTRSEVLATLPRSGTPPPFGSWGEWKAMIERWQRSGVLERPTQTWWDVRVHPALGTLEFRAPDQPTDAARSGALVALLHALGRWAAEGDGRRASRADYHTNRFFASRFGPRAQLIHPRQDRLVLASDLYRELVGLLAPHADAELLRAIDPSSCEADRQLAAGDARAACRDLVGRSLASPA